MTESNSIILVFFIGTLGMILLALSIFFFFVTYQKRMLKKQLELNETRARQRDEIIRNTIQSQENERKRIARDLHDEVGAMLSVVKLNVGRIEKKSEDTKAKILALETKQYLDEVITHVRRISRALLPSSLEKLGLFFAIEEFSNWVNKAEQIKIECWKSGEQFRFDEEKELAVFRIVQELLNNAIKYSDGNLIKINIRFSNQIITISVEDNGKGFNIEEKQNTGLGLKNLESRSELIGAKFRLKSISGKGTNAIICLNNKP